MGSLVISGEVADYILLAVAGMLIVVSCGIGLLDWIGPATWRARQTCRELYFFLRRHEGVIPKFVAEARARLDELEANGSLPSDLWLMKLREASELDDDLALQDLVVKSTAEAVRRITQEVSGQARREFVAAVCDEMRRAARK